MVPSGAVSKPEPGTKQGDRGKFRRNLDDFSSMCLRLSSARSGENMRLVGRYVVE